MNQNEPNFHQKPELSVIIPVYNTDVYLGEAIDSILRQDFYNFEIIAINDGSSDQSGKILDSYRDSDPRVHVYHRENAGLSATRNFGLSKATGSYIYFFDSDDVLVDDAITRLIRLLNKNGGEIITFSGIYIDKNGEFIENGKSLQKLKYTSAIPGEDLFIEMMKKNVYSPVVSTYLYRKDFLIENKLAFLEGYIHEDEFFTIKALCLADSVLSVSDIYYKHRSRSASIMGQKKGIKNVLGWSAAVSNILEFTENDGIGPTAKKFIKARAQLLAHNSLKILHKLKKENGLSISATEYFDDRHLDELGFDVRLRSKYPVIYRVYKKIRYLVLAW